MAYCSREALPHDVALLLLAPQILQKFLFDLLSAVTYVYCNRWLAQVGLLLDAHCKKLILDARNLQVAPHELLPRASIHRTVDIRVFIARVEVVHLVNLIFFIVLVARVNLVLNDFKKRLVVFRLINLLCNFCGVDDCLLKHFLVDVSEDLKVHLQIIRMRVDN